jgi:hypothetical protein
MITLCAAVLLVLLATSAYLLYYRAVGGGKTLAIFISVMTVLATAQLAIQIRTTFLGFEMFRFAIRGEQSRHATDLYAALSIAENCLFVANK